MCRNEQFFNTWENLHRDATIIIRQGKKDYSQTKRGSANNHEDIRFSSNFSTNSTTPKGKDSTICFQSDVVG